MKGIVIDSYSAESYISSEDGMIMCIGVPHVPSGTKNGSNVSLQNSSTHMINHRINQLFF